MRRRFKVYWKYLRPYSVLFLPAFLIGIVAGAYPGYKVYEYVWKDAGFCISCHVHDYATFSWKGSAHGRLTTCHDCHHQPLHAYMLEPLQLVFFQPKFPKDLHHTPHVPQDLCESCHVSGADMSTVTGPLDRRDVAKIPKVDRMYLHRVHLEARTRLPLYRDLDADHSIEEARKRLLGPQARIAGGSDRAITCTDCHGGPANRGHNFSAGDISCVRCHSDQHRTKVAAEHGCRSCHFQGFVTPVPAGYLEGKHELAPKEH